MDTEVIRNALVTAIAEIQVNSGRPLTEITDSIRPLQDLGGFDSVSSAETGMLLSEKLGCEIAPSARLFVGNMGQHLRIDEAVIRISEIIENDLKTKKNKKRIRYEYQP